MARLVHLAPDSLRRRIERAGLRGHGRDFDVTGVGPTREPVAIFAMPVLEDFAATHQWVRELRRWRRGRLVAVHFEIPDGEEVLAGRFGPKKDRLPVAEAVSTLREAPWGKEVVVRRRVPAKEIAAIRELRQDVGWVETPDSDHKYQCVCAQCLPPGSPDVLRRCRAAFNNGIQQAHSGPGDAASVLAAMRPLDVPLERVGKRLEAKKLFSLAHHDADEVRRCVAGLLGYFRKDQVLAPLLELLGDPSHGVRSSALEGLLLVAGPQEAWTHVRDRGRDLGFALIELLEYWPRESALETLGRMADEESDGDLSVMAGAALQRVLADESSDASDQAP